MSRKSYTTQLLLVVAVLVVGPSVGIVVALPTCNSQKANNPESRCRYTDLSPCEGRDQAHCTGDGQYPASGNWGDCSSGLFWQYCGYPQEPKICFGEYTCTWYPTLGQCRADVFVRCGYWTWPENYPCDVVA